MSKKDWNRPSLKTKGKKTTHWHWNEIPLEERKHEKMVEKFLENKENKKETK